MCMIPTWIYQRGNVEKVIAYLRFVGREDLIVKFETQGFLYLSEIFETPIDGNWSRDCKSDDYVDFLDFGREEG